MSCRFSFLSIWKTTTLFLMDYDAGRAFADDNGLSVVWVMDDGEIRMTDGTQEMVVN